jgi:hypothetical protein
MAVRVTIVHQVHGHLIEVDENGQFYRDDKTRVDYNNLRPCAKCKLSIGEDDHDPCIANLPGTATACCGHGLVDSNPKLRPWGYVVLKTGRHIQFQGDVGAERIRQAVDEALSDRPLPDGFAYDGGPAVRRVF